MVFIKGKSHSFLALFLLFAFFTSTVLQAADSREEARRVLNAIDKIMAESLRPDKKKLRHIVITERELNSYIAYRIETEKEEIMRELRLKLLDGNKLEGKIFIDLQGKDVPRFIRPQMNFYFSANLQTEKGRVKVNMKELFLEGESIQPVLLDLVIFIAAKLDNAQASSINDWYDLPFGIQDIKTKRGHAVFFY